MIRILDIAAKDLRQLIRERNTFLFLLIMPVIFTLLFGYVITSYSIHYTKLYETAWARSPRLIYFVILILQAGAGAGMKIGATQNVEANKKGGCC